MATITSVGTYLPTWGPGGSRVACGDEVAVTLAVASGVAALCDPDPVTQIVIVSHDLPLLEGGNSAAVIAGLGNSPHTRVSEVIGGAPAALDAVAAATRGAIVIGTDVAGAAGAAAVFCGSSGVDVTAVDRIVRSMPVNTRDAVGHRTDYADPRLLRVRGLGESLSRIDRSEPIVAAAGLADRDARPASRTPLTHQPCGSIGTLAEAPARMQKERRCNSASRR